MIAIGAPAFRVASDDAMKAVYGYAVGLDMTRRDLQNAMKEKQRPGTSRKPSKNRPS